ncbi:MAG: P-loop ATPase, Sll1717 family, partial [Mycobacteriales bacterium]
EERYLANRKGRKSTASDMWEELFTDEVRGLPTRDYLLWRILPRPRDLIYLANAALTTAINRRHHLVHESDIVLAETQYSKFAFEALLVESEAQGFDLEEALFEFAGLDSTIDAEELDTVLRASGCGPDVHSWLVRTSFLGVEVEDGSFAHVEGEAEARRKLRAAQRLEQKLGRQLRFRVHPAFRHHLDIRDDDLHSPAIRDTTLTW